MIQISDTTFGAIAAAVIAGIISLLGLIISKEQKTSEFRQAWIDALRADLTGYLTQIHAIQDAVQIEFKSHDEKVTMLRPHYLSLNTATFDIILRINKKEKRSKRVRDSMLKMQNLMLDEKLLTPDNIRPIEARLLEASQDLLKFEWNRVKSGEISFIFAKIIAAIFIIVPILLGIYINFGGRVNWISLSIQPTEATSRTVVPAPISSAPTASPAINLRPPRPTPH